MVGMPTICQVFYITIEMLYKLLQRFEPMISLNDRRDERNNTYMIFNDSLVV